jgi:hypothetical protein
MRTTLPEARAGRTRGGQKSHRYLRGSRRLLRHGGGPTSPRAPPPNAAISPRCRRHREPAKLAGHSTIRTDCLQDVDRCIFPQRTKPWPQGFEGGPKRVFVNASCESCALGPGSARPTTPARAACRRTPASVESSRRRRRWTRRPAASRRPSTRRFRRGRAIRMPRRRSSARSSSSGLVLRLRIAAMLRERPGVTGIPVLALRPRVVFTTPEVTAIRESGEYGEWISCVAGRAARPPRAAE